MQALETRDIPYEVRGGSIFVPESDRDQLRLTLASEGLPANHVFMLHEDEQGKLWIGTNNGLTRMDEGGFKTFTTSDGLYSNRVFAMTTSADGSRWIGSFGGVARIMSLN